MLRHLLRDFDLTWTVRDGVLLITTPEEAEWCMETKIYDVLDLIKVHEKAAPDEYDYDSIISLITTSVAPQSWDTVGGPGTVEAFRGGVVITQTQDVHGQMGDMLTIFRRAKQIAEEHTNDVPPTVCVDSYADDPAVVRIKRALEGTLTFEFTETPLHDVAEFIAAKCDINVVLDHRALDDVGIGDDVPVTFEAKHMQVRHALAHILRDFELRSLCRDHALLITTPEEAECILATRAYPIADLLGESLGTDMFGDPQRLGSHDDVIDLLTSVVAPESWDDVGGPGSIDSSGHIDVLVVSQTPDVHEQIADLFQKIRCHLAKCKDALAATEGTQKADATRLVIYALPAAASKTTAPPTKKADPNAAAPQNEDAVVIPEDELLAVIVDLIEPGSWQNRDDVYAKAVPGRLIIRHTDAVHRQIGQLLGRLKALRPPPGDFMGALDGIGGGFF